MTLIYDLIENSELFKAVYNFVVACLLFFNGAMEGYIVAVLSDSSKNVVAMR